MATLGKKAPKAKGMASKPKVKKTGVSDKQKKAQNRIKAISERAELIQKSGGTHIVTKKVYNINRADAIKEANEILYGNKRTIGKKKATPKKKTTSKAKPKKKGFSLF